MIFEQCSSSLLNSQVVQQFGACMGMFVGCCTTSPVRRWFSHRSHLFFFFKISNTSVNKWLWREFIQLHRSLPELLKVECDVYKNLNLKDVGYDEVVWACCYDICPENEVCANLTCRVWSQPVVVQHTVVQPTVVQLTVIQHCCANLFDRIWGPLAEFISHTHTHARTQNDGIIDRCPWCIQSIEHSFLTYCHFSVTTKII
jgi:hypothetical protein